MQNSRRCACVCVYVCIKVQICRYMCKGSLELALKRNKTSAMIGVRGRGAKTVRRTFFAHGRPELELSDLRESIQVVPHYKHLGCFVDLGARLHHEVRHRTALATAAYDKARDLLLQNRDLTLATRSSLFQCAVVSTYHNLAIWVTSGRQWEAMSDAFSRLVRRLLCREVCGDDLLRVPLPLAHWMLDTGHVCPTEPHLRADLPRKEGPAHIVGHAPERGHLVCSGSSGPEMACHWRGEAMGGGRFCGLAALVAAAARAGGAHQALCSQGH